MSDKDVTAADTDGFWDPHMRASIEMTEKLATVIHEEIQELRNEMRKLKEELEKSVKKLLGKTTKSGEKSPPFFRSFSMADEEQAKKEKKAKKMQKGKKKTKKYQ